MSVVFIMSTDALLDFSFGRIARSIERRVSSADAMVCKISVDGELLWERQHGGVGSDCVNSLVVHPTDGSITAVGMTDQALPGHNNTCLPCDHQNHDIMAMLSSVRWVTCSGRDTVARITGTQATTLRATPPTAHTRLRASAEDGAGGSCCPRMVIPP